MSEKLAKLGQSEALRWVVLLLTPAVMYGVFEGIIGNLASIGTVYALLNLVIFYLIYLTVFALTNSMRISFTVLNVFFTFVALAEYFVVEFRQWPIMPWDVLEAGTAASIASSYTYDFTPVHFLGIAVIVAWTAVIWLFPAKIPNRKYWAASAIASAACCAVFWAQFNGNLISTYNIEIDMWRPLSSYAWMGYMLSSLRAPGYLKVDAPDGYSLEEVNQIIAETRAAKDQQELLWKDENNDFVPTNIICIMNESYSDLHVIAPFNTNLPFMTFYDSMGENCIKGELYVPVYGFMTSNSEFEFLTANNDSFLPKGAVPYSFYMKEPTWSLAHIMKQQGYRTVAVHPNLGSNWNRNKAYPCLGFDDFYDINSFENAKMMRDFVSDQGDYEKIVEITESKEESEPLFIFNVTMQNHRGYEGVDETVWLTDFDEFPMTNQYLSLIRASDEALEYLINYYSGIEEPTMIVLFGDHQPSIEPEFYETLYGGELDLLPPEDHARMYITPFFIWTNYETESKSDVKLSAQYLSLAVLQRANLEMSDYQYFLNAMSQEMPVIQMFGYYNSDGVWEDWENWKGKKEYPLLHRFEFLQYNYLFDKNRVDDFFH